MARGSIEKLAAVGYLGGSLEHTISGIGCGQREQWHWKKLALSWISSRNFGPPADIVTVMVN